MIKVSRKFSITSQCLAVVSEDVDGSPSDVTASFVAMTTGQRVVDAEDVACSAAWWLDNSTNVPGTHSIYEIRHSWARPRGAQLSAGYTVFSAPAATLFLRRTAYFDFTGVPYTIVLASAHSALRCGQTRDTTQPAIFAVPS